MHITKLIIETKQQFPKFSPTTNQLISTNYDFYAQNPLIIGNIILLNLETSNYYESKDCVDY